MSTHTHHPHRPHGLTHGVAAAAALALAFTATEAVADGGAVRRGDRSTTVRAWSGPRTSGVTARRVDDGRAVRTMVAGTRDGRRLTGARQITRDGDEVTVDRHAASGAGGSVHSRTQYEFDDGRVESIERRVTGVDRYGRTASWEGRAERDDGRIEFEGEGHTRAGRHVEIEGAAARGRYGAGLVADVEGGRYGDRTVVAGRRDGGPAYLGSLPPGAVTVRAGSGRLFVSAGVFYRPITVAGVVRYRPVVPPVGVVVPGALLPANPVIVTVRGRRFFVHGHTFYTRVIVNGRARFVVAARPPGL